MANVRSLSDIKKEGGSGGGGGGGGRGGGGGPSHGGGGGHGHAHGGGRGQQAPQDNKNVKMIGSGEQFKKELSAAGERLVIVDWSAEWCGPCRQMAPVFAQLSTTYTNAVFLRVDVDDLQELAHQYNIKSLPTFTFIRAGRKIDEMIGASPEKLEAMVKQHVGQAQALPSSGGYRLGGGGGEPSHAGAAPHPTAAASSHAPSAAAGASAGTAAPAPGPAGGSAKDSRRPANAAAIAQLQEMGPWSKELCEKALLETGNSVPNALDWLFTHGDEAAPSAGQKLGGSAPPPQAAAAAAAAPAAAPTPAAEAKPEAMQVDSGAGAPAAAPAAAPATDVAPPHLHNARCDMCKEQIIGIRYKCNDCVDFDLCSGCEVKKTHDPNHTFTAYEKEYVQPELTPEQVALQKQRIAAKLAEIRKKEEEEAAKAEKEREITRRKEAKNTEEAKRKWEEAEAKRAADKARREKEAEEKHKAKVLEQLRIDKLNREAAKKKAEGGQPDPVAAPAPAAPAAAPAAPAAKKEYTECVVQIRTADGKTLQQTFKPTDTLRAVYTFAQQSGVKGNFALLSTFPRKVYHGAALDSTTLQQAELVPRGNLNVATSW